MGQYQRWQHLREVDQLLQAQLRTLEEELAQVEEHMSSLAPDASSIHKNLIIQLLIEQEFAAARATEASIEQIEVPVIAAERLEVPVVSAIIIPQEPAVSTISPALSAWAHLPNFDTQKIPVPDERPIAEPSEQQLQPVIANADANLLPTNISAFVIAHQPTEPPISRPWWFRRPANPLDGAKDQNQVNPVDQQSQRTNRLVERWFQRWEHQNGQSVETQEKLRK